MLTSDTTNVFILKHIIFITYSVKPASCSEPVSVVTFTAMC